MNSANIPKRGTPEFVLVNEPFDQGRAAWRLFFDFGALLSCMREDSPFNKRILDFACGTGWLSEWLNRMGFDVYAIDIDPGSQVALDLRAQCEKRLCPESLTHKTSDGHSLPFVTDYFSHICCFDSLHHMRDYQRVLAELYRVLELKGRAIFVEPGARHSTSKETIEFIEKYKKDDPEWIERDVVIDEIHDIAMKCGFKRFVIRPSLWPQMKEYDFGAWRKFRAGDAALEKDYVNALKDFNYNSRLVFYLEK